MIHGLGRTSNEEQIEQIIVKARDGVPIRVRDVAKVQIGYEIRRGAITADGKGEAVLGLGFMRMGENSNDVTTRLKESARRSRQVAAAGRAKSKTSTTEPSWSTRHRNRA